MGPSVPWWYTNTPVFPAADTFGTKINRSEENNGLLTPAAGAILSVRLLKSWITQLYVSTDFVLCNGATYNGRTTLSVFLVHLSRSIPSPLYNGTFDWFRHVDSVLVYHIGSTQISRQLYYELFLSFPRKDRPSLVSPVSSPRFQIRSDHSRSHSNQILCNDSY